MAKKKKKATQHVLRQLRQPPELDRALRKLAQRAGQKSMNAYINAVLAEHVRKAKKT